MIFQNIWDMVGNTPLVEIKKLNSNKNVKIFAKLEGFNPLGSVKDRPVKYMILEAEKEGKLRGGETLIEATSGNTGIAMAAFAKLRGYKFIAVMPEDVSSERVELIKGFGADVVFTDAEKGTNGAIVYARELAEKTGYIMLDQFSNYANVKAHYETTAEEIIKEVPHIDIFIAGLGTGGTLTGVGKRLRELNKNVKIIAVQPYPQVGGLAGLRNILDGYVPPILDIGLIDATEPVMAIEAITCVRRLATEEGIFCGISSGAAMYVAIEYAKAMKEGVIVTILPDGGWKYLSERILTEPIESLAKRYKPVVW